MEAVGFKVVGGPKLRIVYLLIPCAGWDLETGVGVAGEPAEVVIPEPESITAPE